MYFQFRDKKLYWQNYDLVQIAGTIESFLEQEYQYVGPYYLYNESVLEERLSHFDRYFPSSRYYFSVKSLSNTYVLSAIARHSQAGLDVVSGGEILRGLQAGFSGSQMVYAGVGKNRDEVDLGLRSGLKSFHVESVAELKQIEQRAKTLGLVAPVTLRLNPDIPVETHAYIATGIAESKFGLSEKDLAEIVGILKNSSDLKLIGLQSHLGSQLKDIGPHLQSVEYLERKAGELSVALGVHLEYLSIGGGFGIDYESIFSDSPSVADEYPLELLANAINQRSSGTWRIDLEPGRYIAAHAGILVSHLLYLKEKQNHTIAITDAGMSELLRPSLYGALHQIIPMEHRPGEDQVFDIVGPICESGDFFAKNYRMGPVNEGDRLVVVHTGAYGSVMASNYNSRPFAPEFILVDGKVKLIRKPQMREMLFANDIDQDL